MAVRRPTADQIAEIAADFGMHLAPGEADKYLQFMAGTFDAYDEVDATPDNLPPVRYPRTPGYRPQGDENKYGAWARKARIDGASEGLLKGKTAALKDCICVAGVPMANGAQFLEGYTPEVDATVVTRILDAGGTILGKATCEYLCLSGSSHTSWPAPVRNPWNTAHSAGGSSSGSAALVAAGEVDMSLGGDQGGSIRIPAAWCGIVGMKPTYGLIPYTGIMPIELTVDHTGPMTASVFDNALLLQAVAGADGIDPRQQSSRTAAYTETIEDGAQGLRIGIVQEGFATPEAEQEVSDKVRQAAERFRGLGAAAEEVSVPIQATGRAMWTPTVIEGITDMMMRGYGGGTNHAGLFVTSAMDAMAGWRQRADELSVSMKVVMLTGEYMYRQYNGRFYGKSQNLVRAMRAAFDEYFQRYDLLLMPTTPQKPTRLPAPDAPIEEIWDVALNMNRNTSPSCGTGHPALTVPCGLIDGLPIGMMLIGRHWEEATIYRAAYAFEQTTDWKAM